MINAAAGCVWTRDTEGPALQKQRCRNYGYRSSDVETMDKETMDTETMDTETGFAGSRDGKK